LAALFGKLKSQIEIIREKKLHELKHIDICGSKEIIHCFLTEV